MNVPLYNFQDERFVCLYFIYLLYLRIFTFFYLSGYLEGTFALEIWAGERALVVREIQAGGEGGGKKPCHLLGAGDTYILHNIRRCITNKQIIFEKSKSGMEKDTV